MVSYTPDGQPVLTLSGFQNIVGRAIERTQADPNSGDLCPSQQAALSALGSGEYVFGSFDAGPGCPATQAFGRNAITSGMADPLRRAAILTFGFKFDAVLHELGVKKLIQRGDFMNKRFLVAA